MPGAVGARRDAEDAADRVAFLSEAGAVLASSLDYEATLRQLARLAVLRLADWCAVDMVAEDGSIERLAVAHEDPDKVRWAYELQERYPPDPAAPNGVPNVLRTGEPEFFREIPGELLVQAAGGDEELLRICASSACASRSRCRSSRAAFRSAC